MHKFRNLHTLSSWKQEFMLSVLDLLINHSYLADQMKAAMKAGGEMPDEVKQLIRSVRASQASQRQSVVAPIP
ncbi:hypothetical protein OR1_00088 [Geobacter sp. OR-1]|nr:hypothetical protein [Geobacter sp. OR-1]GAM07819.1 hypothetical protein OR1_00088 [Geobacter sp. OR-1]